MSDEEDLTVSVSEPSFFEPCPTSHATHAQPTALASSTTTRSGLSIAELAKKSSKKSNVTSAGAGGYPLKTTNTSTKK